MKSRASPGRQQGPGAVGEDHHLSASLTAPFKGPRRRDAEARLRIRRDVAQQLASGDAAQHGARGQGEGHLVRVQHVAQAPVTRGRRKAGQHRGQGAGPGGTAIESRNSSCKSGSTFGSHVRVHITIAWSMGHGENSSYNSGQRKSIY